MQLQPYDLTKIMENMLKTGFNLFKDEDAISCVPAEKYRCVPLVRAPVCVVCVPVSCNCVFVLIFAPTGRASESTSRASPLRSYQLCIKRSDHALSERDHVERTIEAEVENSAAEGGERERGAARLT